MAEEKRKRWESNDDQQLAMRGPDKDIACASCKWRLPEILFKKGDVISQADKAVCVYYKNKPYDILFKHSGCEFYEEYAKPKLMTIDEWEEKYEKQFFPG